jgi:hypothetical protein
MAIVIDLSKLSRFEKDIHQTIATSKLTAFNL